MKIVDGKFPYVETAIAQAIAPNGDESYAVTQKEEAAIDRAITNEGATPEAYRIRELAEIGLRRELAQNRLRREPSIDVPFE